MAWNYAVGLAVGEALRLTDGLVEGLAVGDNAMIGITIGRHFDCCILLLSNRDTLRPDYNRVTRL